MTTAPDRIYRLRWPVVAAVAACFIVSTLVAPSADADPAKAKALMAEAREAAKANKLPLAIEKLQEAAKNLDHPAIFFAQARVFSKMLLIDSAEAALKRCEDFELPGKMQKAVAKQYAALGALKKKYGGIRVTVEPASAVIMMDGDKYKGGLHKWLEPGQKRLEISADGYQPAVRPATIEAGNLTEIRVKLKEVMGSVRLSVPGGLKGVQIKLDGKSVDIDEGARAGDVYTFDAKPGAHEIICARGDKRDAKVLKVEMRRTVAVSCDALGGGMPLPRATMGWGGVGVGAVLAGLGGYHIQQYLDVSSDVPPGFVATKGQMYGGTAFLVSGLAISVGSYLLFVREPAADGDATAGSAWSPTLPMPSGFAHGSLSDPSRFEPAL